MITVHHLEKSRSQRILWLLEELALDYAVTRYARDPATRLAPPALLAIHPLGKSPVIVDGDLTIAESGAIVAYLVDRHGHGRLAPAADTPERLRYDYWLHYAEGSAMTPFLLALYLGRVGEPAAALLARVGQQIVQHLDFVEAELAKSDWLAGALFTAADVQMSFPLELAAATGRLQDGYPRIKDYLARSHSRPAYRRALERGGPYDLTF